MVTNIIVDLLGTIVTRRCPENQLLNTERERELHIQLEVVTLKDTQSLIKLCLTCYIQKTIHQSQRKTSYFRRQGRLDVPDHRP